MTSSDASLPFEVLVLIGHLLPSTWRDLSVADVSGGEVGASLARTRGGVKRLDVYGASGEIRGPRGVRTPRSFFDAAELAQDYDVVVGRVDADLDVVLRHAAYAARTSGLVLLVLPLSTLATAAFGRVTRLWAPRIVLCLSPRLDGIGDRVVCVWRVGDAARGLRSMSRFMVAEWRSAGASVRFISEEVQPLLSADPSPPVVPAP